MSHPTVDTFELVIQGTGSKDRFVAWVPNPDGTRAAEHEFEWRTSSLAMIIGELEGAATYHKPPENNLHITFGKQLFNAVFGGEVGTLWHERTDHLKRGQYVRLVLRPDHNTARPLLNVPWEYLHDEREDGEGFLATDRKTPVSRLPWGLSSEALEPLGEPLRVLVVISAPHGLSELQVLNTAREEDLILEAQAEAQREGLVQVEFTPNASLDMLSSYLREFDPHLLHFIGHGVFDSQKDEGSLLMETSNGQKLRVSNKEFAELLEEDAVSLRGVLLWACQSARVSRNEGYADLGPRLLRADFPAVVAMQFSVLDSSAMQFGSVLYREIARGKSLDIALTEGRKELQKRGPNSVDFATPTLYLTDPNCLKADSSKSPKLEEQPPQDFSGLNVIQNFVGRNAELRELRTGLDPRTGKWRAAIIHGLGGLGKTTLATRLAQRMASRFKGMISIRMTPTTTAQSILDRVAGFVQANRMRLGIDSPLVEALLNYVRQPLPLETKASLLVEFLARMPLLLVFDNYEDVLPKGRVLSKAANPEGVEAPQASEDPDLSKLIAILVANTPSGSRFLFTTRYDFDPVEPERFPNAVHHLPLSEMRFTEAVYLMGTLPPLDELPIAGEDDQEVTPDQANAAIPLTKRALFNAVGGHPFTLGLFAEHAKTKSVRRAFMDLAGVQRELVKFTLLDRAVDALTPRAADLLRCAAIYDGPVPKKGLSYILGSDDDATPDVDDEVQLLLDWGLMTKPPGTDSYQVHSLVRDWMLDSITSEERERLLDRAAGFWIAAGNEFRLLDYHLVARHYLFRAKRYEEADNIVSAVFDYLVRWGQIELVLSLLDDSVRTLEGHTKARALGNRATIFGRLGDYKGAGADFIEVLKVFRTHNNRQGEAATLHNLGNLFELQGDNEQARKLYEQSLAIKQEIGDRSGVAITLHQLGNLHYLQGDYEQARELYEQSLDIAQEIGDRSGVASTLHQLGMIHQDQGEYEQARKLYEQSLAIKQEIGDRSGVAITLHQLGNLHYLQGDYEQARELYEQSLAIKQEIGDRSGVANTLHQLGNLHQDQGEYEQARELYEQSLAIQQEIGNRSGVANTLHQLGNLHYDQGEYEQARKLYEQSLAIMQEIGDRSGMASSLGQLGLLNEAVGKLAEAVAVLVPAFILFKQLASPNIEIARAALARLREKMGEETFNTAVQAALDSLKGPDTNAS